MAWKRSRVRISPGPPNVSKTYPHPELPALRPTEVRNCATCGSCRVASAASCSATGAMTSTIRNRRPGSARLRWDTSLNATASKAAAERAHPEKWVFTGTDGSGLPLWDSGVRQALKKAAAAEGCDFPGLGPHSFRRANITWRQEVGGSSIETSKIAGHSTVRMTEEYTKIQLTRQEELTRLIQERLASVGEKVSARDDVGGEAAESPSSKSAEVDWTVGGIQTVQ